MPGLRPSNRRGGARLVRVRAGVGLRIRPRLRLRLRARVRQGWRAHIVLQQRHIGRLHLS
eukprot:scaffold71019_cov55-Phaeocystis_antarctica.AAC.1